VYHLVGERKIGGGVLIDLVVEVLGVAGETVSETVVEIEHTGHSVEPETVHVELVEIVAAVGQEEVLDFRLSVIETERIPVGVDSALSGMEIGVACSVDPSEPLDLVAHRV
jgi:hypothetical protein